LICSHAFSQRCFLLSSLIKNKYGDLSSPGDISPQEATIKLFKIFNSSVSNANIGAFDPELEVEGHLVLESEDDEFVTERPSLSEDVSLDQMQKAVEAYDGAPPDEKFKAAQR
jgi:hypothetical protein